MVRHVLRPLVASIWLVSSILVFIPPASAATIVVDTNDDELNADGDCSLREAVRSANLNTGVDSCASGTAGPDTITVPAGGYTLAVGATGEDAAAEGDFDVTENLTIDGAGTGGLGTTISGGSIVQDRLFEVLSASLTLMDLRVEGGGPSVTQGGGVLVSSGNLTLTRTLFQANTAGSQGGAVFIGSTATSTVTDSFFTTNTATDQAGGIHFNGSTLSVSRSTFTGGHTDNGGGIYSSTGATTITNSTFSNNNADGSGGGLHVTGTATATVTNSTFTENSTDADNGGGPDFGGNLYVDNTSATLNLETSIVANGTVGGAAGDDPNCSGTVVSGGHNLLETATDCGGLLSTDIKNQDPNLSGSLSDNGGSTQTDPLMTPSPALDAVPAADGECTGQLDQRGIPRPQGAGCDIGAYEYVACFGTVVGAGSIFTGELGGALLTGTGGPDVILGGPGPDVIDAGNGADKVCAGGGDDNVDGGPGDDSMAGQPGTDTLTYASAPASVAVDLSTGTATSSIDTILEFENVTGSPFDDSLTGDAGPNRLEGGGGNDALAGMAGEDTLAGNEGNDLVTGGDGIDSLDGGGGDDALTGDAGDDILTGSDGDDQQTGGVGNDQLTGGEGNDGQIGEAGNDRLTGGSGKDRQNGGGGNDTIKGQAGNDRINGGRGKRDRCRQGPGSRPLRGCER